MVSDASRRGRFQPMTPPSRSAITRGDILTIAAGLTVLAAVMVLSHAAFVLAWILVYAVAAACALEMARNLRWFVSDDYPVFLALSVAVVATLQPVSYTHLRAHETRH